MTLKHQADIVFVFYGRSGAGKSTLMSKLAKEFNYKVLDILQFVQPNKLRYPNNKPNKSFLQSLYNDLINAFQEGDFQGIELPSGTQVKHALPKLLESVRKKGKDAILIHCVLPLRLSQKRNELRGEPVPNWILLEQDKLERKKDVQIFCLDNKIPLVTLDCALSLDLAYSLLIERLNRLCEDIPQ